MDWIYGVTVVALSLSLGACTALYLDLRYQKRLAAYYKGKYDLLQDTKLIQLLLEDAYVEDGEE